MKVHHVGYLVKDMDASIMAFQSLGYKIVQDTVYDRDRQIDICFLSNEMMVIEVIAPRLE